MKKNEVNHSNGRTVVIGIWSLNGYSSQETVLIIALFTDLA